MSLEFLSSASLSACISGDFTKVTLMCNVNLVHLGGSSMMIHHQHWNNVIFLILATDSELNIQIHLIKSKIEMSFSLSRKDSV